MGRVTLFIFLVAVFVLIYSLLPTPVVVEDVVAVDTNDNIEGPKPVTAMDLYAHIVSPIF